MGFSSSRARREACEEGVEVGGGEGICMDGVVDVLDASSTLFKDKCHTVVDCNLLADKCGTAWNIPRWLVKNELASRTDRVSRPLANVALVLLNHMEYQSIVHVALTTVPISKPKLTP